MSGKYPPEGTTTMNEIFCHTCQEESDWSEWTQYRTKQGQTLLECHRCETSQPPVKD